jgi:hypothetical protein
MAMVTVLMELVIVSKGSVVLTAATKSAQTNATTTAPARTGSASVSPVMLERLVISSHAQTIAVAMEPATEVPAAVILVGSERTVDKKTAQKTVRATAVVFAGFVNATLVILARTARQRLARMIAVEMEFV